jgi:hypothetical protein
MIQCPALTLLIISKKSAGLLHKNVIMVEQK